MAFRGVIIIVFTGQRNDDAGIMGNALYDTRRDIRSFANIFYKVRIAKNLFVEKKKKKISTVLHVSSPIKLPFFL